MSKYRSLPPAWHLHITQGEGVAFSVPIHQRADLHQRRMWPLVCMATAAQQGSFHQQTNVQMASPSTHCDTAAAGTLGKSKDNSIFFSPKAK